MGKEKNRSVVSNRHPSSVNISFFVNYAGYYPAYSEGERVLPFRLAISGVYLRCLLLVFLYVVQAQRDDFENNLHHYFFPILFLLFSFHFQL